MTISTSDPIKYKRELFTDGESTSSNKDIKCLHFSRECRQIHFDSYSESTPCGWVCFDFDELCVDCNNFSDEDTIIECWEKSTSKCVNHPLYLQNRQKYYLECVMQNSKFSESVRNDDSLFFIGPHLKECEIEIQNSFKDSFDDVLSTEVKSFLSTFYKKMEVIGDMMTVLRMPNSGATFRPMHQLYRTLGIGNLTVLCWWVCQTRALI